MKENNVDQCVAVIREYLKEQQPNGIKYLEQHGLAAEELKLSSPTGLYCLFS